MFFAAKYISEHRTGLKVDKNTYKNIIQQKIQYTMNKNFLILKLDKRKENNGKICMT